MKKSSLAAKYMLAAVGTASFANADGQFNDASTFGGNAFNGGAGARGYSNADGVGGGSAPTSQPYVINVVSTSGAAVANFDVLGANEKLGRSANWVDGSYVDGSITISSGVSGVTYQEMLYQFQQQPFKCALTYYQSATANQILQSLSIVTKDVNGNSASRPIVPTIDPYQYQSTILAIKQAFNVDGGVKMTVASVLANSTITFQLYPADKVNVAKTLEGQSAASGYSDPGIVKAQEIRLT